MEVGARGVGNQDEQASLEISQGNSLEDDEDMFNLSRNTSFVSARSSIASSRSSSSLSDALTIRSDFSFGRHIGGPEIEEMIDHRWLPFSSRWEVDGSGSRRMPAPGAASSSSPFASQARTRGRQIQESVEPIRLFTIREIQKATNNFDQSLLIRRNGYTELYRGTISGFTQPVAIKVPDFKSRGKESINVMINDIAIRSRISHRNVANLIGVCLEDERLCSVYEFFPNGTLDYNLFNGQMPWETRLKVAAEIAGALAYMHSSLSNPIIHRDVKPAVIHIDSDYTSKIFDLEMAKSLPDGLDHVATRIAGTIGYLDPEYLHTGWLTCKADVYSFGILLVQFLTRKRAFDVHESSLIPLFLSSLVENTLEQIFDTEVVNADTLDQMKNVADLARKCLELRSEMRPSMARVALALEQLMVDNSFPPRGNIHHSQSNNTVNVQPSFSTRSTNKPIYSKLLRWMRNRQKREFESFIKDSLKDSLERYKIYTMKEISIATNNFDNNEILGKGKSVVFRGKLLGNKLCAIKKSVCHDSAEESLNEINSLSQLSHKNIVGLLGFCKEAEYPVTIHEYMAKGALSSHIHSNSMSWELRLRISVDVAKALSYLHSSLSTPIIHGDVKTSNILLDDDFTAKIADFGLASKLNLNEESHVPNVVHGVGYLDPEYGSASCMTCKSDVYSFGVVLAQLLTGKEAVLHSENIGSVTLAELFVRSVENNLLHEVAYCDTEDEAFAGQIKEVADLAQRCLCLVGNDRPSMAQVALKLEQLRNKWLNTSYNDEDAFNTTPWLNTYNAEDPYNTTPWLNTYNAEDPYNTTPWLNTSYNDEDLYNTSDCELSDTDFEEFAR